MKKIHQRLQDTQARVSCDFRNLHKGIQASARLDRRRSRKVILAPPGTRPLGTAIVWGVQHTSETEAVNHSPIDEFRTPSKGVKIGTTNLTYEGRQRQSSSPYRPPGASPGWPTNHHDHSDDSDTPCNLVLILHIWWDGYHQWLSTAIRDSADS
ncbi:uncharacterized protein EI90DRAFT_3056120 [Cantharellus anzutake]|uniref:uncharacterized protein n=1 Tax=Cantharellus anzutake TaxID=1750568 RepID=UPI0019033591|nr:uncharacterized protein EI90DRAFT_3056120 [Cantharellus anzutake]KAF8331977.1 hypothetical protein EI90DRAFT_3056120 [Cantharellus anzutake]